MSTPEPVTRLPDGALLLSESLTKLLELLKVEVPSPLYPEQIPQVLATARAAQGAVPHPLLAPLVEEELSTLEALAPADDDAVCLLFDVQVVAELKPGERKHTVHQYLMVASSKEQALAHLKAQRSWVLDSAAHIKVGSGTPLTGPRILHQAFPPSLTAQEVEKLTGAAAPSSAPASRGAVAAARPLSDAQQHVLKALQNHKNWYAGCGWVWGTSSNTRRVLEALERRGLATSENGTFTLTPAGDHALDALPLSNA